MRTEEQLITLLTEVLKVAKHLVKQRVVEAKTTRAAAYNPWRAYEWDKVKHKNIYLGAFPSVNKAKEAQRAFRNKQPVTSGTKAVKLHLIKKAA